MKDYLLNKNFSFYTHVPLDQKNLKVVIKGLPTKTTEEEINHNLTNIGYEVEKISRMFKQDKISLQMVLIELRRKYKYIYNMTKILGLIVKIAPLRNRKIIIQCHRCLATSNLTVRQTSNV